MINGFKSFEPGLVQPYPTLAGLRMFVGPSTGPIAGAVVVNNALVQVPTQFVPLGPATVTYVYLDMTNGLIRSNNAGFSGNIYPIAIVTTDNVKVTSLTDARPDVYSVSTGGGGGSSTDVVAAFVAPQIITLTVGQNLFGTCVAAANSLGLPNPSGLGGQTIKLIKTDTGTFVGITGAASGTYFLSNQYQFVIFETDGNSWYVIGNN